MRKLTETEIQELIEYLQGTCMSLYTGLEHLYDIDQSDVENEMHMYMMIDDAIFMCTRCGWWCETGDWISDDHPNYDPDEETCSQCGEE